MGGALPKQAVSIMKGFSDSQNSAPPPAPVAAVASPTTSEVSQAGATEMDNKGIKRRRRGRSSTILTGSAGVQEGATLGTPTLLG